MDVRFLTKYLPKGLKRRIRKGSKKNKLLEIATEYKKQRDLSLRSEMVAIGNLEKVISENIGLIYEKDELETAAAELQAEILEKNEKIHGMEKIYGAAKNVLYVNTRLQEMCDTIMYLRIIGPESKLGYLSKEEKDAIAHIVNNGNINTTLEKMITDAQKEVAILLDKNSELKKKRLIGMVATACHSLGLDSVPIMLYQSGEILYGTDKMEELTGSGYALQENLKKNSRLRLAILKKNKFSMRYDRGELFFVPEKMDTGKVTIAYYVPKGNFLERIYSKNNGKRAVDTIYKTLKVLEKAGIEISNGKK